MLFAQVKLVFHHKVLYLVEQMHQRVATGFRLHGNALDNEGVVAPFAEVGIDVVYHLVNLAGVLLQPAHFHGNALQNFGVAVANPSLVVGNAVLCNKVGQVFGKLHIVVGGGDVHLEVEGIFGREVTFKHIYGLLEGILALA